MAIEGKKSDPGSPWLFPGAACTVPFLLGMVLVFTGERLVETPQTARMVLDAVGAAVIVWAIAARASNWLRAEGERRSVEGRILSSYAVGAVSLVLYALQVDPIWKTHQTLLGLEKGSAERIRTALGVLWPVVWASAVLPMLFMEVSYASMARAPRIEKRRVAYSEASGLTIAWVLASLFLLNYAAQGYGRRWDLSLGSASSAGEETRRLVSNLSDAFEVILFYPDVNEVREELVGYFGGLKRVSEQLRVRSLDQVLEPKLAKELGVSQNGSVVFRYGDRKTVVRFGLTAAEARSQLAKLDQTFREKFLELVSARKVAYFTVGHGERSYEQYGAAEKDPRAPLKGLRTVLKGQNFEVKILGVGQGLASEVPEDASLVFVVDPAGDFLPGEIEALHRYLDRGGRLWVALDPDRQTNLAGLLLEYGVRFVESPLANDTHYVRVSYNKADRYNLYTNRPTSHESVRALSNNAVRLAVVLLKSGSLEKVEGGNATRSRVEMTLRSMPETWRDENRDMEAGGVGEAKGNFDLCAAVRLPVGGPVEEAAEQKKEEPASKADKPEMRMIVLADGDALSDQVIANLGNYYLLEDGLRWLVGEQKELGTILPGQDVRIQHTKKEDVWWFYGTVFGVPLIVLGAGLGYLRLRTRWRQGNRSK